MASKKITVEVNVVENGKLKKVTLEGKKAKEALDNLGKGAGTTDRAMKGVAGATSNTTKSFAKQAQGLGGLVHAYATVAANAFALSAAFMALQRAADLSVLKKSMDIMDRASGTNLVGMANALKVVTKGMITFEEAARHAAIVSAAGFGRKELSALGKVATATSQALGRDFGDSMDRLVRGVVKAEPELLDELGIILRLDDASKKYAATVNKNVNELSTYEKQVAVMNEVLQQGNDKYGVLIDSVDNVNELTRLQATATEILVSGLEKLVKVISPVASFLSNNTDALKVFMSLIGLAIFKMAIPAFSRLTSVVDNWAAKSEAAFEKQLGKNALLVSSTKEYATQTKNMAKAHGQGLQRMLRESNNVTPKLAEALKKSLPGDQFIKEQGAGMRKMLTQSINQLTAGKPVTIKMHATMDMASLQAARAQVEAAIAAQTRSVQAMTTVVDSKLSALGVRWRQYSAEATSAAQAASKGWQQGAGKSLFSGYTAAIKGMEASLQGGVATVGKFQVAMGRAALTVRVLGGAMMSLASGVAIGYGLYQAYKMVMELFKSDEAKAMERSLEAIKSAMNSAVDSSVKFREALATAQGTKVIDTSSAIKQTSILKNAYTQLSDSFSETFATAGTHLQRIDKAYKATAHTGLGIVTTEKMLLKLREDAAVLRGTEEDNEASRLAKEEKLIQFKKDEIALEEKLIKLRKANADLPSKIFNEEELRASFEGVKAFFDSSPIEFAQFINTDGLDPKMKEIGEKIRSGSLKSLTAEQAGDFRVVFQNFLTSLINESATLESALKSVVAVATSIPRDIVNTLVPSNTKFAKVTDDINGLVKSLATIDLASPENKSAALDSLKGVMSAVGYSQEQITDILKDKSPAEAAGLIAESWKVTRKALEGTSDVFSGITSNLVKDLHRVKTAGDALASLTYVKENKGENEDALQGARDKYTNAQIADAETLAEFDIKALERSKLLLTTDKQKLAVDRAILSRRADLNQVVIDILNNQKGLSTEQRAQILLLQDTAWDQEDLNGKVQTQKELTESVNSALKEQARNYKAVSDAAKRASTDSIKVLEHQLAIFNISNKPTGQYAQGIVLARQEKERELVITKQLAAAESRRLEIADMTNRLALLAGVKGKEDEFRDLTVARGAKVEDANVLAEQEDRSLKILEAKAKDEILSFPKTMEEGWNAAMRSMSAATESLGVMVDKSLTQGVRALGDGFVELIVAGDLTAKSFSRMAASIVSDLLKMIAKQLIFNAISGALGMVGGGASGGAAGGATLLSSTGSSVPTSSFQAGHFATGGIVNKPTVSLFGEAGAEAFVPLPDGKTIPVTMEGAGGGGGTNNVAISINIASDGSASSSEKGDSQAETAKQLGRLVSQAVQRELITQQRPGGILSRGN